VESPSKASAAFCMEGILDTLMSNICDGKQNPMEVAAKSVQDIWTAKGTTFSVESNVRPVGQERQFPWALVGPTSEGNVRKWKKQARRVGGNESPNNNHAPIGGKRRGFNNTDELENYQLSKRGKGESSNGVLNSLSKAAAAVQPRPQL
jgi:hypothetical protein